MPGVSQEIAAKPNGHGCPGFGFAAAIRSALKEICESARQHGRRPVIEKRDIVHERDRNDGIVDQVSVRKDIEQTIACPDNRAFGNLRAST